MRKSDKKLDHQIRLLLTDVCEAALKKVEGFQWLTHLVNFSDFPSSLKVVCIFDTNDNLKNYITSDSNPILSTLVQKKFQNTGIGIKNISRHISYDTEENCTKQHAGNWAVRLAQVNTQH